MADPKIYKLILGLYTKTRSEDVKWARSIDREFIASFQNYSVGVSQSQLPNIRTGDHNIYLKIYDSGGEEIERTSSDDFDGDSHSVSAYTMLAYIYENARRMAMGVDTALDTLLMELGV